MKIHKNTQSHNKFHEFLERIDLYQYKGKKICFMCKKTKNNFQSFLISLNYTINN